MARVCFFVDWGKNSCDMFLSELQRSRLKMVLISFSVQSHYIFMFHELSCFCSLLLRCLVLPHRPFWSRRVEVDEEVGSRMSAPADTDSAVKQ